MQKSTAAATFAAILLGGLCAWQAFALKSGAQKIAALESQLHEQQAALKKAADAATATAQHKKWLDDESQTLRKKIATLQTTPPPVPAPASPDATPPKKGPGFKNFLTKMMNDPEMREQMKKQTREVLKTTYASLFKEMGLTAEQGDQLIDLLVERQMKVSEASGALLTGEPADKKQAAEAMAASRKAVDEQIRASLGDANFQTLEKWEANLGTRMQMDQFKGKLAAGTTPLQSFQSDQLSTAMQEENARAMPGFPSDDFSRVQKGDMTFFMDSGNVDKMLAHQADVNQRVLDRSRSFLNGDQIKALGDFQKQQMEQQKFGLKMAAKMFGDSEAGQ